MALILKDRVKVTSTSTGTGTFTLGSAVAGYQDFSVIGNGNTTYYAIVDNTNNAWEVGLGTYTASGTTLSRDTILESSSSGSIVDFAAGEKNVFVTYPAERAVWTDGALIQGSISGNAENVEGVVAIANGGTGLNTIGSNGTVLTSNGTIASWETPTAPAATISYFTTSITTNTTFTSGQNGLSVGPVTISDGVTVTVPSGQRWVVL